MSEFGSFDVEKFTLGGFLDGREGRIDEARFKKFDYNGTVDPPANVLSVDITRDDGETRNEIYGIGGCTPLDSGLGYRGGMKKTTKFSKFLAALKSAGFDTNQLNEKGAVALDGLTFIWKHVPTKAGSDNSYALPDKLIGGEDTAAEEDEVELKDMLSSLVVATVADAPLKKAMLSAKISPKLNGHPQKTKALTLLVSDTFLATIEGIVMEDGLVKAA